MKGVVGNVEVGTRCIMEGSGLEIQYNISVFIFKVEISIINMITVFIDRIERK